MNKRFADFWNDYLEGDLDEVGLAELQQLLQENESLLQFATDSYQTHRLLGLLMQDSDARHDSFVRETLAASHCKPTNSYEWLSSSFPPNHPGSRRLRIPRPPCRRLNCELLGFWAAPAAGTRVSQPSER